MQRGRPDEAVCLLSAWAATGQNDKEGQQLLADALRIDPSAKVAQLAFERMEGVPGEGDHQELDNAIAKYDVAQLTQLEAEMRRPVFRRAQMGFNNNIKYQNSVFHVQTEDSGLDQPHVITHLFADGGRVIKSHKRSYADFTREPEVAKYVRSLMKSQHLEMCVALREGRFDEIIAGRQVGGLQLLVEPPTVDIRKLASGRKQRARAGEAPPSTTSFRAAPPPPASVHPVSEPRPDEAHFRLTVLRSLAGGPEAYEPTGTEAVIGSEGEIQLKGEVFCHAREALLSFKEHRLWLEDLEGGNGVFLRINGRVELELGDEFVVGDQLLRVEPNPSADDGPDPDPTYFYSSPKWPSSFRIAQVLQGGAVGACVVARGNTLQIGAAIGDLVFPDDPLVAEQHCIVEEQAGSVVLSDMESRTGVFVRIRGEQELVEGDELLVGRTRLVVHLT